MVLRSMVEYLNTATTEIGLTDPNPLRLRYSVALIIDEALKVATVKAPITAPMVMPMKKPVIRSAPSADRCRNREPEVPREVGKRNGFYVPGGLVVGCLLGCNFARLPIPKFGFRCLHAVTTCGSICGNGFVPCATCGVPAIIGRMQSTMMLAPVFAPFGTKPACLHAAAIWSQGPPLLDAGWPGAG